VHLIVKTIAATEARLTAKSAAKESAVTKLFSKHVQRIAAEGLDRGVTQGPKFKLHILGMWSILMIGMKANYMLYKC